ncbi:hypothetical protein GQR58_014466 [Nymphon striatum]|nr:hypothetical protein GQR58_014466 [Nymphon striatum]
MRSICIQRRTLLRPEWTTTGGADAQQFLIHDSGADTHNRMLVFRAEQGLQHLCRSNTWFDHGWNIFSAPRLFKQLYIIHAPLGSSFVKCSYAFLSGKSQDDYEELLQSIVREYEATGYIPDPLTFVTDFELTAIWALETTFRPHVRCQRCFYHLTQSTWRKIQELGLVELYKTNEDMKLYCGMLDGLGFLPEDEVAHTSNQAATKIQRWFRNSRTEETSSDTNSVLVKVLNAKKKEINRKLQANKRRRETLKGNEYSPYLYDEKRASVSSYKEALLGNPVDFSTLLSSQNYSSQFSSQNSLNFKTSDYSTSILSLNPSKDHIFKFKDEDDDDDTFLQSKQKEYITKYIDVDFAIHKCGEIFPEPNGTVLPEETARPTDIKINNEALEKTSVDISPKQSSDAKKNLTNCTYQELLDTLKDFGKSETATTNEHVDKEDQQLSEKSEKLEKSKSQHLPVEENVSISSFMYGK